MADFNVGSSVDFGEELEGVRFGGISAVTYDESRDRWIGLSDARRRPRFFELAVDSRPDRFRVSPLGVTFVRDAAGTPFEAEALDPEGLAVSPWGTLLVASEADSGTAPVKQPKLLELAIDGRLVRELDVPSKYLVEGWPPAKGVRDNLGFEALTLSPDGSHLFVGVEQTLLQDGAVASFDRPGFCRILELRVDSRARRIAAGAEYVYPIGPLVPEAGFGKSTVHAGLVELLALSNARLLALERIFIREDEGERRGSNRARIFLVDLSAATNVFDLESLADDRAWQPVMKELLLDFDDIVEHLSPGYQRLDNFEAMGLGPALSGGGLGLLVASDDNFQKSQRTAFLLFRLLEG